MKRRFENLTKGAARAIKHWWLLAVAGILCILLGIVVFAFPLQSYVTLAILFGVLLLIVGAAKLISASTSANFFMMRGYVIVSGVLDLLIGIFLCIYPGVGTLIQDAITQSDYNMILGCITISIVAISTCTLIADLIYPFIDPRIRYS